MYICTPLFVFVFYILSSRSFSATLPVREFELFIESKLLPEGTFSLIGP